MSNNLNQNNKGVELQHLLDAAKRVKDSSGDQQELTGEQAKLQAACTISVTNSINKLSGHTEKAAAATQKLVIAVDKFSASSDVLSKRLYFLNGALVVITAIATVISLVALWHKW